MYVFPRKVAEDLQSKIDKHIREYACKRRELKDLFHFVGTTEQEMKDPYNIQSKVKELLYSTQNIHVSHSGYSSTLHVELRFDQKKFDDWVKELEKSPEYLKAKEIESEYQELWNQLEVVTLSNSQGLKVEKLLEINLDHYWKKDKYYEKTEA